MSPTFTYLAASLAALALGWGGAALAERVANRTGMLDGPGERRSHEGFTPRGGGVGIAPAIGLIIAWLWCDGGLAAGPAAGWLGGLGLVAGTGWLEDRYSLPIHVRLAAQAAAVGWFLYWTGGLDSLWIGTTLHLGPVGWLVGVTLGVWLINLYNFMDGIDALAASEGIFAAMVLGALLLVSGEHAAALIALAIAASCAGFLPWNRPPARLFMGDVGSTTLGFAFAALLLDAELSGAVPLLCGLLVLSVFFFDALFTLLARMASGARWYTAHREHAYQYMVRSGLSHRSVVLRLMAVNLLVILPVVVLTFRRPGAIGGVFVVVCAAAWWLWFSVRRRSAARFK